MLFRRALSKCVPIVAVQLVLLLGSIASAGAEEQRKLLELDLGETLVFVNPYPNIDGSIQIVVNAKTIDGGPSLLRSPLVKMNTNDGHSYFARLESVASKDSNKRVFYRFIPMELSKTTSIEIDGKQAVWGSK